MQNALSVTNFTKAYRNGTKAVDDISFVVPKGSFFGFLGPNGAGKTTTIKCMTGISYPSSGTIEVFGHDVVNEYKQSRSQIGLSPQEFNAEFFAKVYKVLEYVGGYYGLHGKELKDRIEELLDQFELQDFRDKPFNILSGGYKRRVMLARALIHNPDLIILDEPTAGVDVELRHQLWKYFEDLNKAGKTIILTSHYIEEVQKLCEHVAIINKGKIVADKPISEYTKDGSTLEEAYLKLTRADAEHTHTSVN